MSAFEKCCWYWNFWNLKIENELKELQPDRWMFINIDNLDSESENLRMFLNIPDFKFSNEHKNKAHKRYKKTYQSFKLKEEHFEIIDKYCGKNEARWFKE